MKRTALTIALGCAALTAAAGSPASAAQSGGQSRAGDQCFLSSDMTNWRAVGVKQVNVEVRNRDVYRLDLGVECPELRFAGQVIGIEARGGGAFICGSTLANIRVPGQGIGLCPVTHITKYTPDEVKALPKKERP